MASSFFSTLFHQFMAGRLRAEMPGADENVIQGIVQRNVQTQVAAKAERRQRAFRHPFRHGPSAAWDVPHDVPRVGVV